MQIIQLFRRRPPAKAQQGSRGPRGLRMGMPKRPSLHEPADDVDEIFAKLAAVPWIRKTPVEF
jgi:hypothetical protein